MQVVFWSRFKLLCDRQGAKPNPVGYELGVSSATLTKWKNGSIPNGETLIKISEYFNVSIDYLLGRTNIPEIKSSVPVQLDKDGASIVIAVSDEMQLITAYRSFSEEGKEKVLSYVNDLICAGIYKNDHQSSVVPKNS